MRFHFAYLGIDYAGLHTDMQHMGYVLNIGETGPPAGLLKGLKVTNRMQDLILEEMQLGKTGNEVLSSFRARCDILCIVYNETTETKTRGLFCFLK